MAEFPAALPHGPVTEIFPDTFVVRGSFRVAPLLSIARNMIIVREGEDLTLINPVRLLPEAEPELEKLGTVRHVVKLGYYHNRDDAWARHRYKATYWAPRPADPQTEPLREGQSGPASRLQPFVFSNSKEGEAALLLSQPAGGLLITCDSVQHWENADGCSWLGGFVCRQMGFFRRRATIGPIWSKEMTGGRPAALRPDFDRLLAQDFVHLISAHGAVLHHDAKTELAASVQAVLV